MMRGPFIETFCSKQIREAIDWCVSRRKPILITGPAGIGKTTTINHIVDNDLRASLLVGSTTIAKSKPLLTAISSLLFGHCISASAAEIERELWLNLGKSTDGYLIIDEAQFLEFDALRTALALNDQAGLPIAFVGNPTVLKRTKGRTAAFDQVSDRMRRKIELIGTTEQDIASFGAAFNVEGKDAYAFLAGFSAQKTVRAMSDLLDEARRIASGGAIRLHHLSDASLLFDYRPPTIQVQ